MRVSRVPQASNSGMTAIIECRTHSSTTFRKDDTHQHHFSETPVLAGGGVRAVEVNVVSECERKVNL